MKSLLELRAELKKTICGQDNAIDLITLYIYKHVIKQLLSTEDKDLAYTPNICLLIGETGTGKTYLCRELSKLIKLPIIEIQAREISLGGGWHGKSFTELLSIQLRALESQYPKNYLYPIIIIDEFDKICRPLASSSNDNWNMEIQATLLRVLDGLEINIGSETLPNFVHTGGACFIFSGAFQDLLTKPIKNPLGFHTIEDAQPEIMKQLIDYGMMPELAGRLTRIVKTQVFTREMYRDLLCNENFITNKWFSFFKKIGLDRKQEPNYTKIITEAVERKLGVRGLCQLLEDDIIKVLEDNKDKLNYEDLTNIILQRGAK